MGNDPALGLLGLARRAGKLGMGDEQVKEMQGKIRAIFLASDAGGSVAKKVLQYAGRHTVCVTLPQSKTEIGAALGRAECAVCAVSDMGMAAAVVRRLAERDSRYQQMAQELGQRDARFRARRLKKQKTVGKPGQSLRAKRIDDENKHGGER